jgi:hypothetical protein
MSEEKIYGVIVEWKEEGPIVKESELITREKIRERSQALAMRPDVIRVAIFRAIFVDGNKSLIPEDPQP